MYMQCQIESCQKVVRARHLCGMHYERWRKHGDPMHEWKYSEAGLKARQESLAMVREQSPSYQKKGKRVTLRCSQCEQEFRVTPAQAKRRKYCSKSCLGKSQKGNRPPMSSTQRRQLSLAQKQRYARDPTSNPFYGRTPTNYQGWGHGQFVEELGYWVRSTWERDYLLALQDAKVPFMYEPQRFDLLGARGTYMPDLRLGDTDTYVEITGWDKPGKAYKRQLFREVYGYTLLVVDKSPTPGRIVDFVTMCQEVMTVDDCSIT